MRETADETATNRKQTTACDWLKNEHRTLKCRIFKDFKTAKLKLVFGRKNTCVDDVTKQGSANVVQKE